MASVIKLKEERRIGHFASTSDLVDGEVADGITVSRGLFIEMVQIF